MSEPIDMTRGCDKVECGPEGVLVKLAKGQAVIPHNVARYGVSHADFLREHGMEEFRRALADGRLPKFGREA